MLTDKAHEDGTFTSSDDESSSAESQNESTNLEAVLNFEADLERYARDLTRQAVKEGVREAAERLSRVENKEHSQSSYLPFKTLDLSMKQIFCIVSISWIIAAVLRYAFLADGRLATRGPGPSRAFFPINSSVADFYRGNGASYAELYNKADLTILMFYAQWSLHSVEARKHFLRVARAFDGVDNVKFTAVNCDVGECKRSFKLYSFPVIVALTSSNTAVLYEDYPLTELMFSWVNKLLMPLHRVDSIDDELITSNKYDHVVLAYLPLKNGQTTHAYKVYQLAAMKNRERYLFAVTLDPQVAADFGLNESNFKVLDADTTHELNVNSTSTLVLNAIHEDTEAIRHTTVQWIWREYTDDGGKSIRLHSLANETRALLVLMTTPVSDIQTSPNLEKLRQIARLYNDCSKDEANLEKSRNWAQELVDESYLACDFQQEMITDCCETMWHDKFCTSDKDQSVDLSALEYRYQCKVPVNLFGKETLQKHCCMRKYSSTQKLNLPFRLQMACRYLRIFNLSNGYEMYKHSNKQELDDNVNEESNKVLPNLKSFGLACRTNRTVQFAAMDLRHFDHFSRQWNLNRTDPRADQLVLLSINDETVHTRVVGNLYKDADEMLAGYANYTLEAVHLDESKRGSHYSKIKPDVDDEEAGQLSSIERLTGETFRSRILNDTDRTYSAVVFFSGGSWHGQSMAATHILHTVHHEFATFNTLIRFFIIDVSRNTLPWSYVFDSLPALMFFPGHPFPLSQSTRFPNELVLTVPNLMAFLLSRAQPELRFRVALRGCTHVCLETNRMRLHQFEQAVRQDIRSLRLMKRKYAHRFGANFVTMMLRKRKLQMNASKYLQRVLQTLHSHQSSDLQLSSYNETLIVQDSLLLRWLLSNNFGTSFDVNNSFRL